MHVFEYLNEQHSITHHKIYILDVYIHPSNKNNVKIT